MAGFTLKDISTAKGVEEDTVKRMIADVWDIMKKVNWDLRKFCMYNPKERITFPVAKSFKSFFDSEGWNVRIIEDPSNYKFTIYKRDVDDEQ